MFITYVVKTKSCLMKLYKLLLTNQRASVSEI